LQRSDDTVLHQRAHLLADSLNALAAHVAVCRTCKYHRHRPSKAAPCEHLARLAIRVAQRWETHRNAVPDLETALLALYGRFPTAAVITPGGAPVSIAQTQLW
jgi:hypothetical protein